MFKRHFYSNLKYLGLLSITLLLSGCPLDGDQGRKGDDGIDGINGADGVDGINGINCWDLNENGAADPEEDINGDSLTDVLDCRPAVLFQEPEERTWYISSRLLLNVVGDLSDDHYLPIYDSRVSGCRIEDESVPGPVECLGDPIPDPCELWQWDKTVFDGLPRWYVKANQGYNVETLYFNTLAPPTDTQDPYFGWTDCRDACLGRPHCVGASIEAVPDTENNAMACRLIARSNAPDNSSVAFRNPRFGSPEFLTQLWGTADEILFSSAILSVCPKP